MRSERALEWNVKRWERNLRKELYRKYYIHTAKKEFLVCFLNVLQTNLFKDIFTNFNNRLSGLLDYFCARKKQTESLYTHCKGI